MKRLYRKMMHFTDHSSIGALAIIVCTLSGCSEETQSPHTAQPVNVQIVNSSSYGTSTTLTGEIRARVESDLAFRFAGRIATRNVDVGDYVKAGQVLAQLESSEQISNVDSATAGVTSAEASLREAESTFEREKSLLERGFTTKTKYDNAEETVRVARASLDSAKSDLATMQDQLNYTTMRAEVTGIITSRNVEAGQVVEAAQAVFTLAHNGARDAVFDVHEGLLTQAPDPAGKLIEIVLLSDPTIKTNGRVREIAPAVDPLTGTVKIKVGIENPPAAMQLGAAVAGIGKGDSQKVVRLPWTAFFTQDDKPAVWVVDPVSNAVAIRLVTVDQYLTNTLLISEGLEHDDIVVTAGVQLLWPGKVVAPQISIKSVAEGAAK
jgi:RND family efflux transporter MFP subunit